MDFTKLKKIPILTKRTRVTISLDFLESSLTIEEVQHNIQVLIKADRSQNLAGFVCDMLRAAKASMWEESNIEIKEIFDKEL